MMVITIPLVSAATVIAIVIQRWPTLFLPAAVVLALWLVWDAAYTWLEEHDGQK
jgi:hypothetical protein